jgi:peptidoglycan/xylan/chitin deacetylase (PgdA/CDA1 family)
MHPVWGLVSLVTAWGIYTRVRAAANEVYLTFDDGPNPEHTPRVLDLLSRHGARATFFLQGELVEAHGGLVEEIVARGHALGNHSYSHVPFDRLSLRKQADEIQRTNDLLQRFDGRTCHAFRPPYGRLPLATIALCTLWRQRVALWTHDSNDFALAASDIVDRFSRLRVQPGDIVLFHDDQGGGAMALENLLPAWRSAGLEFAPL